MNKKQSIGLCSLLLTSAIANANVSGTVYQDLPLNVANLNTFGTKDSNEKGVAGITVKAYSDSGTTTTTTDANGLWSLASTGKVKVEFTNIPSYLKESAGQSSVQFIDDGASTVDLALYNPAEYADSASNNVAMTLQPNSAYPGVVSLKILNKDDIPTGDNGTNPTTANDTPLSQTGSIWGLAYDSSTEIFYASAVVRRHAAMGDEGLGAIYQIKDGVATLFTKVENVGTIPSNIDRAIATQQNHDSVFDEVGRVGLGDIDISADGTKLYTINLNTNQLVEIDIKTKAKTTHDIGNPFQNCPSNDVKSWGIGQNSAKVYVGSICTSNTTQGAYISEFNGNTFTPFHHIPLDMKGENSVDTQHAGNTLANNKRWGKWIINPTDLFKGVPYRSSLAAPILSDIVFDENNNMIIGFTDRTALQSGTRNFSPDTNDNNPYKYDSAGDIYKVCNISGNYVNEGEAGCTQNDANAVAPAYPEFFTDEEWNTGRHKETALGGLAYLQGSHSLISSSFDPTSLDDTTYNTSGLIWMNTQNGHKTSGQRMVGGPTDISYQGKAGGIGDIEILTASAPTEIGNRVWFDENKNCVQDANESGIAGVEVSLYASTDCTGVTEGTATTDANGRYLFPVKAGKDYSVCINNIAGQSVLNDKKLTCNTKGTSINNSDAIVDGNDAKIAVAPLTTGANNHAFDFGFVNKDANIPTPVVVPEQNNSVNDVNNSCDCNSYTEDSSPALNVWSAMLLITLTSFMAFLFRKELEQPSK